MTAAAWDLAFHPRRGRFLIVNYKALKETIVYG